MCPASVQAEDKCVLCFLLVSIRLCPSQPWQKELLFSHRPGGQRPLGQVFPHDWQLRKHNRPPPFTSWGGGGVSEWELNMVTPYSRPYTLPSHFWPGLCSTAHITFAWHLGVTCAGGTFCLTFPAADQEYPLYKKCPLSPVILTPVFSSLLASLIQYQQSSGCQGAVPACVGTSASCSNSGVTETDDCVKAVSPEGAQSSSPPKPSTLRALLSHVPYCNDLMLIQDQRPRASIYIKMQETGIPPRAWSHVFICVREPPSRLCGCKCVYTEQILLFCSHIVWYLFKESPSEKLISESEKILQDDVWMLSSQFSPLAAANEIETEWTCSSRFCCE